jgi:Flp pilus assembly protein TadD
MSLINDVLKDLERRPQSMSSENLLAGMRVEISSELSRNKKYYQIIGLLCVALVLSCVLIMWKQHNIKMAHAQRAVANAQPAPVNSLAAAPQFNQLTGIAMQVEKDTTFLRILLTQNSHYQVSREDSQNLVAIVFENTRLLAPLPKIDFTGSNIQNIQAFQDENNNLKIVMTLSPHAEIKRLELNQQHQAPELQMDVVNNPAAALAQPLSIKKAVTETLAEQKYQYALRLSNAGQDNDAIEVLQQLLQDFPLHSEARQSLAAFQIKAGDALGANQTLDTGLKLQRDFAPFIQLKARLLADGGNITQALAVLEKNQPSISEDPEYFVLMAALYQRAGQAPQAVSLYKQLLALEPSNAKWWLGLGISLETAGSRNQAIEAFANADNIGGLSPELKAYLDTKLTMSG